VEEIGIVKNVSHRGAETQRKKKEEKERSQDRTSFLRVSEKPCKWP
jgi:hypothetical protein